MKSPRTKSRRRYQHSYQDADKSFNQPVIGWLPSNAEMNAYPAFEDKR